MIKRLDRVAPLPVEEFPLPDPTVLSAEEQDRFRDLLEKGARAAEGNGTITKAELQDLERLWSACPPLPPGDGFARTRPVRGRTRASAIRLFITAIPNPPDWNICGTSETSPSGETPLRFTAPVRFFHAL